MASTGDLLKDLTWLDAVWIFLVLAMVLRGLLRGLMQELLEMVSLALSVYAGWRTYGPVSQWLLREVPALPEQAARAAAFAAVAGLVMVVATAVTGMLAHLARLSPLSWVDALAGAAFGALKGLAVVAVLVVLVAALPDPGLRQVFRESRLSRQVEAVLPQLWASLQRYLSIELPPLPAMGAQGQQPAGQGSAAPRSTGERGPGQKLPRSGPERRPGTRPVV
ncbi:MAG TPA: CvpA family protein [Limnochordales bacterium]